jgi:dolichol-phosphate mannosyltransferase
MGKIAEGKAALLRFLRHGTFLKFGLVGASGVVVNNGVLWLLTHYGMRDLYAAIIATETAIISNFIGNSLWTWRDHGTKGWQRRFLYFQAISLIAGALTVLLFWTFHNIAGMQLLVANTLAILITFIVNYALNSRITWAKARPQAGQFARSAAQSPRRGAQLAQPVAQPVVQSTAQPAAQYAAQPDMQITMQPTVQPTVQPDVQVTGQHSAKPAAQSSVPARRAFPGGVVDAGAAKLGAAKLDAGKAERSEP